MVLLMWFRWHVSSSELQLFYAFQAACSIWSIVKMVQVSGLGEIPQNMSTKKEMCDSEYRLMCFISVTESTLCLLKTEWDRDRERRKETRERRVCEFTLSKQIPAVMFKRIQVSAQNDLGCCLCGLNSPILSSHKSATSHFYSCQRGPPD